MGSELKTQSHIERIHQSLEEVDSLLSTLEEQSKSGTFTAQLDVETETSEPLLVLEDGAFLTD